MSGGPLLVAGASGSGKSTLLRAWLSRAAWPVVAVVDPEDEHGQRGETAATGAELLAALDRAAAPGGARPRIVRHVPPVGRETEAAAWLARWAFARGALLVVDEAHLLADGDPEQLRDLEQLARRGRKRGSGLWLATQRPADVPPRLHAGGAAVVSFRLGHPADLEWARVALGWDVAAELRDLPPFRFVARLHDGTVRRGQVEPGRVLWLPE